MKPKLKTLLHLKFSLLGKGRGRVTYRPNSISVFPTLLIHTYKYFALNGGQTCNVMITLKALWPLFYFSLVAYFRNELSYPHFFNPGN